MIDNRTLLGYPIPFQKGSCIYPPKIKEVITNPKFFTYLKILTQDQDDIDELFKEEIEKGAKVPSPYFFMYKNFCLNENIKGITLEAFEFFLHEKVTFLEKQGVIIIGDLKDKIGQIKSIDDLNLITEKNFLLFQNLIRIAVGEEPIKEEETPLDENPKVTALKKRFKAREKLLKKIKAKNGTALDFTTCMVAICCMQIGITPLNIGELSYGAISPLMSMYQKREEYDTYSMGLMFGTIDAKKNKVEYWIRNSKE